MVSSVRSRPNHYEMLGLTPRASDAEIQAAFARKMSAFRWHPAGSTAQVCVAYETLRDPARRRVYDLSLGIIPRSAPRQWGFAVTPQRWAPFVAAPAAPPVEERAAPAPEPHVTAAPEPEAPDEPRVASFIAASLRDLARPVGAGAELERHIQQAVAAGAAEDEEAADERPFDWTRPALAVGGFVLAAGLIGTLAGLSVKEDAQSAQAGPVAAVARPAAKAEVTAPVSAAPEAAAADAEIAPPKPRASHKALSAWAERQVDAVETAAAQEPVVEAASEPFAQDPLAPKPAAARLPIPDRVVARTIERIGYSCGEVASTAAVEGARGVFSVTCSSGQTFQATPVHGRYRFRRAGAN